MGIPEFLSETRAAEQEECWEAALGETVGGGPIREGAAGGDITRREQMEEAEQGREMRLGWGHREGRLRYAQ